MASLPTHALFSGNTFVGEVTPNALNAYPAANLAKLPANYWTKFYAWTWSGRTPVEDVARVEDALLLDVKDNAEQRKMLLLSPGGAKKAEYSQKAAEVAFYDSLGGTASLILTALNAMPASARQAKFGYAIASAAAFGDTLPAAIERFRGGMARSVKVPTIAAAEEKTCAAIKAATTATAKRAAAATVAWPA